MSNLKDLNTKITIIKRDSREEPFSKTKLDKVLTWATNGKEYFKDILIRDTEVTLKPKMKVRDMYTSLINTAVGKVSPLQTEWEFISSKLYLLDLYSEAYGIKDKKYPHLRDVLKKGVEAKVYSKDIVDTYSEEDINIINSYIRPEEDYTFTYNALFQFNSKYGKKYTKTKKLELPQITYIRVAMGLCYNLENRLEIIKELYDILTKGQATLATPIMMNALTPLNQFSSCILNTIGNDTWDIGNKLQTAGMYTKGRGGLGFDVSNIQSKGSLTNNNVKASGIVPYIKNIEHVVNSFMQSDTRRGSAVITCSWWHLDIEDFLELKDASSGTPETRALHLKYSFATNDYFLNKVLADEDIFLFCPKDASILLEVYGKEFEEEYEKLVERKGIPRKKIKAKDLYKKFLKYRFQTGNIYEILLDNVNKANMTNRQINSSNLCHEILEPSRPAELVKESIINEDGEEYMVTKFKNEEIALCNLASFNVDIVDLSREELDRITYIVSLVLDNTIDIGRYMRVAGKLTNQKYRYIGLGMTNYAVNLASKEIKIDSDEAEIETFKMSQKLSLSIVRSNARLAKEKGTFEKYRESKWAEGILPIDLANEYLKKEFEKYLDKDEIEETRELVLKYGVRNALQMAIAPTASSATSKNLSEACEPILKHSYRLEGAVSTQVLVPRLTELREFYQTAYDIDPLRLVKLGAIRQMWIDQSQSTNIYLNERYWDYEYMAKLHLYAWKLGVKTQYYLNTPKQGEKDECESCSS